jgi:hypothetical protein
VCAVNRIRISVAALAIVASLAAVGCTSPPKPSPETVAAERARLARLPEDGRTLDAWWRNVEVNARVRDGCAVGELVFEDLKVRSFKRPGPEQPLSKPISGAERRTLAPVDVDRVSVQDGESDYVETTAPGPPELWVHDIQLPATMWAPTTARPDQETSAWRRRYWHSASF